MGNNGGKKTQSTPKPGAPGVQGPVAPKTPTTLPATSVLNNFSNQSKTQASNQSTTVKSTRRKDEPAIPKGGSTTRNPSGGGSPKGGSTGGGSPKGGSTGGGSPKGGSTGGGSPRGGSTGGGVSKIPQSGPQRGQAINYRLDQAAKEAAAGNLEAALNWANAANNLSKSKASKLSTGKIRDNIFGLVQAQRSANLNPVFPTKEDPDKKSTDAGDSIISASSYTAPSPVPSQTLLPGRDVINFTEVASSPEAMQQILFEELSSYELVNMTRGDTVEGLNPYYSVISNLSSLRRQYNPSQIISLQTPIQNKFDIYQISLIDKIPEKEEFFFIDENGDFVIEFENIENDEVIEIQIATSGKII